MKNWSFKFPKESCDDEGCCQNGLSESDVTAVRQLYGMPTCSFDIYGEQYFPQDFYECITCWGEMTTYGICSFCAQKHHANHNLVFHDRSQENVVSTARNGKWFTCQCGRRRHKQGACTGRQQIKQRQNMFVCYKCFNLDDVRVLKRPIQPPGLCLNCAKQCHFGHDVRFYAFSTEGFHCSCGTDSCKTSCQIR